MTREEEKLIYGSRRVASRHSFIGCQLTSNVNRGCVAYALGKNRPTQQTPFILSRLTLFGYYLLR